MAQAAAILSGPPFRRYAVKPVARTPWLQVVMLMPAAAAYEAGTSRPAAKNCFDCVAGGIASSHRISATFPSPDPMMRGTSFHRYTAIVLTRSRLRCREARWNS